MRFAVSYVLRLGFKNVFRQRLRSLLALAGIALSVTLVIVGTSLMAGIESMIFGEVLGQAGEIVVARQDYFAKRRFNPLKYSIKDSAALRERLLRVKGVRAAIERIDFGFLAEHGERSMALAASAVNVEQFARFSKLPERLIAGGFPEPDEKGILIGASAAEELGVGPGDILTVVGRTAYDSFMAYDFEVVGVFDLGSRILNRTSVMPLAPAQEFLEMPDAVSRILVYGESYRDTQRLTEALRSAAVLGEGIALRPWTEDPFFGAVYTLVSSVAWVLSAIVVFVAGLGIFNMMMVTVLERRKEVGVLMALGMPRRGILSSFFCEAALYGLAGGAAGVLLGSPMALYLDRVGIEIRADQIQGMPFAITNTIHGDFGPGVVVLGLVVGVLLAVFGTAGPVVKTFSMGPQDAMTR